MKITYTLVGDYYLPNLAAPESPKVGRWGMLRFNYLRKHREALYTIMLMENTLNPHLEEIDRQAQEKKNRLLDLSIAGALMVEEFKERNDAFNVQILECHGKLTAIRQVQHIDLPR